MAIQKINLGTEPLGEGGDTYRSANTKINENFTNTAHAASRLVGDAASNIPACQDVKKAFLGAHGTVIIPSQLGFPNTDAVINIDELPAGQAQFYRGFVKSDGNPYALDPSSTRILISTITPGDSVRYQIGLGTNGNILFRGGYGLDNDATVMKFGGVSVPWVMLYSTKNTTKDTATGFLKASSPVLHVYNDSITKIHEAEQLDITVDKKGVGHYEIHGTTGLRKNDGWFMSPPRDMHSNILCMVDYEEKDGVIILKTYKKKFDFETVSIVHDYDNPMDIPEGACVEFRFNDLPQEDLGEFPTPEAK